MSRHWLTLPLCGQFSLKKIRVRFFDELKFYLSIKDSPGNTNASIREVLHAYKRIHCWLSHRLRRPVTFWDYSSTEKPFEHGVLCRERDAGAECVTHPKGYDYHDRLSFSIEFENLHNGNGIELSSPRPLFLKQNRQLANINKLTDVYTWFTSKPALYSVMGNIMTVNAPTSRTTFRVRKIRIRLKHSWRILNKYSTKSIITS